MEKINYEQGPLDTDYLNKLYQQEKQLRLANNKIKCLEINIKIVITFYVDNFFTKRKLA